MWPFNKKTRTEIKARVWTEEPGIVIIDVRGQTCPGYLLAINKAVDQLRQGTHARLLITYPPCEADVKAWCKAKKIKYLGIAKDEKNWLIEIKT